MRQKIFYLQSKKLRYDIPDLYKIAHEADVIDNGFAFKKIPEGISVFNLNNGYGAAVFKPDGTLIETNMDDIEIAASKKHLQSCLKYMED